MGSTPSPEPFRVGKHMTEQENAPVRLLSAQLEELE